MGFSTAGASLLGVGYIIVEADTEGAETALGGLSTGFAAAATGALALTAAGIATVKMASTFNNSMLKIQTQAGGTAKDVKVLTSAVLSMKDVQQSPDQLADALYHLKSVGLDNVSAMKDLKVASDLASVGGADLEDTTNALAGAWRSGIKGANTFSMAASTVNAIIGAGNMTMSQFVAAIGTGILPAAKSFGISLSSMGSALALMTDEGVPANEAATRLKTSIALIAAPSNAAADQLANINLTGLQLANEMRSPAGLVGAIGLLKQHLDASGLSLSEQSILLSKAFGGGRTSSAILTMINNYSTLELKQNQINASLGKFPAAVKAQQETLTAQLKIMENGFESMGIQIGEALIPPVTTFVTFIGSKALPAVRSFGNLVANLIPVHAIQSDLKTVTSDISDFFTSITGKKTTPTAAHPLSGSLSSRLQKGAGGTEALPDPVTALSGSLSSRLQKGAGSATSAPALVKAIIPSDLGSELGKQIGDALGSLGKDGAALGKSLVSMFKSIDWVQVGGAIGGNAIGFAIGFLSHLGSDLFSVSFWKKNWLDTIIAVISIIPIGKLFDVFGDLIAHIPFLKAFAPMFHAIGDLGGLVGKALKPVGDALGTVGKVLLKGMLHGLDLIFPGAEDVLSGTGRKLTYKIFSMAVDFGASVLKWTDSMQKTFVEGLEHFGENIGAFIGKYILKPMADAGTWLYKIGKDAVGGLLKGMLDIMSDINAWINTWLVEPLVDAVKDLFGIHSPSTVMADLGEELINGLLQGAYLIMVTVPTWLGKNVADPVIDWFGSAGTWLRKAGEWVLDGLLDGVEFVAVTVPTWLADHVVRPIEDAFSNGPVWLVQRGEEILDGLLSGAEHIARTLESWFLDHVYAPAMNFFSGASRWLVGHGEDILAGLLNGAEEGAKAIAGWASGVYNSVVGAIKHVFGIHSPSTVMHTLGGHMMTGLLNGLLSGADALDAVVKRLFSSPLDAAKLLIKDGISVGGFIGGQASKLWDDLFGGGGSGGSAAAGSGNASFADAGSELAAQRYAASQLSMYGWSADQMTPLLKLWNQECVTLGTVILTRRGWLTWKDVQVGDETIGYNPETRRSEWTKIVKVHHYDRAETVRFGNKYWSAVCTPNHRWLTERMGTHYKYGPRPERKILERYEIVKGESLTQTCDLGPSDRVVLARRAKTGTAGLPITTREAALLGWVAGDGNVDATTGQMVVSQSKEQYFSAIDLACGADPRWNQRRRKYTVPAQGRTKACTRWSLSREFGRGLLERAGHPKDDAVQQVLSMSDEQRDAWLDAIICAEGNASRGKLSIYQNEGPVADAIELAVYLSGSRPSRVKDSRGDGRAWAINVTSPNVGGKERNSFVEDAGVQPVWCVTTELGSWTAKQEGHVFLTGNSGWNADAVNPSSGAYGIPQALGHGHPYNLGDYISQVDWGLKYIQGRYGSPAAAWSHEVADNWYDTGGWLPTGTTIAHNMTGRPERILGPGEEVGGGNEFHFHFHGPVGSPKELEDWFVRAMQSTKRNGRLRGLVPGT